MCQIFAGKSAAIRTMLLDTPGLIESLYSGNSDGLGVMYSDGVKLHVSKVLPKNLKDAKKFIQNMHADERRVCMHWRMKTHGDIDLENTHPYAVVPGIALIHNGILSQGNAADPSRSDTWHYARYLAAMLESHPGLINIPEWRELIEADIGRQNRFVLMNSDGDMHILNKNTGYMHEGVWVANKYSFDSYLLWPEDAVRKRNQLSSTAYLSAYDMGMREQWRDYFSADDFARPDDTEGVSEVIADDVAYAISYGDAVYLSELLESDNYESAVDVLFSLGFTPPDDLEDMGLYTHHERDVFQALMMQDHLKLLSVFERIGADALADIIVGYGTWAHVWEDDESEEETPDVPL